MPVQTIQLAGILPLPRPLGRRSARNGGPGHRSGVARGSYGVALPRKGIKKGTKESRKERKGGRVLRKAAKEGCQGRVPRKGEERKERRKGGRKDGRDLRQTC
jgi:hypothetical protein